MEEKTYGSLNTLRALESVVNTRTPVWNIGGSGDTHVKLDTDVNNQEWYVLFENGSYVDPFKGLVPCWAFPHFNGAFDYYSYVPVAFCFKTFAELLAACNTEKAVWAYEVAEHARRVEMMLGAQEYERRQKEKARKKAEMAAMPPRTVEMSEETYQRYQEWLAEEEKFFESLEDDESLEETPTTVVPAVFYQSLGMEDMIPLFGLPDEEDKKVE